MHHVNVSKAVTILILMSNKADVVLIHLYSLMTGLFTITVYITIIPQPMVPTIVVGILQLEIGYWLIWFIC